MAALMTALTLWTILLVADASVQAQESVEVEKFRRVSAEFDSAQRAAFDAARQAKTDKDREAATRLIPDFRKFAQRFLDLAWDAKDEATIVNALVWVIRHPGRGSGGKTPESEEAVRRIGEQFLRSNRITGICWPIATRAVAGAQLLRRIVEENPSNEVRGQACLGLAFAHRMLLRDVRRYKTFAPERRPEWIKAYGKDHVDQIEKSNPALLVSEIESWLRRVVDDYPGAMLNEQVLDFFPLLSSDLGPSAERILRRAAEAHPDMKTRREAQSAHAQNQMRLAVLLAEVRNRIPESQIPQALEDVPGGESRLKSVDPRSLALEIEQQLLGLADHADENLEAGINYYHLISYMGSNPLYHAGAEKLLRRAAEADPEGSRRASARRSLALYLAGMANESARLRFAAGPDLSYWVDFLGEERVRQIRSMEPDRLNREARVLADQVAIERREVPGSTDRDIENLRRTLIRTEVGSVAPEIEGTDIQGKLFKLSDYRGRVVLLDFWNHRTCPHCREAYPKLRALVKEFVGRPFTLLGVDSDDERADLAQLVKDGTVTWRFWFTHGTVEEPTFVRWNIQGVPNVIVLDHRGVIRVVSGKCMREREKNSPADTSGTSKLGVEFTFSPVPEEPP